MATMVSEPACARTAHNVASSFNSKWQSSLVRKKSHTQLSLCSSRIRACHSMANKKDIYNQVGLFSLKRKIEDAVLRAEMFASTALEMEEASWTKQEEVVRDCDLWDDPAKSNDILVKLANSAKVVDSLKDIRYKAEEAKLIKQLAEVNAIDYGLYKQAYDASLDVSKILDQYELSKLLKGPFDTAGACLIIKAGPGGIHPKLWAEQLLNMYLRWAERQGYEGRVVDRCPVKNRGINSATIEFEFECAYGYLSGERGVHNLIRGSPSGSSQLEDSSAIVDVIPMYLENALDLEIDSEDLIISSPLTHGEQKRLTELTVCIQHLPTGISVQSSGERSHFANKMKALNRLKAKLQVIAREQGVANINSIRKDNIANLWQEETRRVDMLMVTSSNIYSKCGMIGVSHYTWRDMNSTTKTNWFFTRFPAFTNIHNVTAQRFVYKMSSEVLFERGSNVITNGELQDFPLSSYEIAMEKLSSLITRQRRGEKPPVANKLENMSMYLKILGLLEEDINRLKIIHVAGTKGKGSTCIFCEAILRECGFRTGVFTSPHLIDVRERFRIDGIDISEDKFLQYFWDCWNQLEERATEDLPMPPLFQFLTILAFKIFISEQVDAAIIEVGLGGKEDSTNVITEPTVCGITSLGMDHTEILGDTLGQIASHKAGIFKPKVPAFTVPQPTEAMDVILERAKELMVPLEVTEPFDFKQMKGLKLRLSGDHQFYNAALAVSLCRCWLQRTGNWEKNLKNDFQDYNLPDEFIRGLSAANFSGRAQIVYDSSPNSDCSEIVSENCGGELIFYLDGAHSPESMEACAKWFCNAIRGYKIPSHLSIGVKNAEESSENDHILHENMTLGHFEKSHRQILLFNCLDVRNPHILLPQLVNTCASSGIRFSRALFVPSMSKYTKVTSGASVIPSDLSGIDLSWQLNLQKIWEKIMHGKEMTTPLEKDFKTDSKENLPPHEFLYDNASNGCPSHNNFAFSAVMPSLPLTIKWLRDCIKEHPSTRLQVLVTGSLHLVGDVLKLLKR
ncbi:Peptide chain release factor class I/class II [Sesbania bispinosa]|nr:Peptide chain release factor class I/class II [Sesbania bispinosa]